VFVVRTRIGEHHSHAYHWGLLTSCEDDSEVSTFLDIKSEHVRDILRVLLEDVPGISLGADMPSVSTPSVFTHVSKDS